MAKNTVSGVPKEQRKRLAETIQLLDEQCGKLPEFQKRYYSAYNVVFDSDGAIETVKRWHTRTATILLERVGATEAQNFQRLLAPSSRIRGSLEYEEWLRRFHTFLDELLDDIGTHPTAPNYDRLLMPAEEIKVTKKTRASAKESRSVFIVHGHDEAAREKVARFLEKLDLKPIILHEQANRGRTIIEKFEDHSGVGFAVVLLTPDDVGRGNRDTELQPRARQNVILELGYFIGILKRSRVCALHSANVELPSDYDGVLYVPLDEAGAWRLALANEIKASGIAIALNRAV